MVGYASDRSFDSLSGLGPTLTHPTISDLKSGSGVAIPTRDKPKHDISGLRRVVEMSDSIMSSLGFGAGLVRIIFGPNYRNTPTPSILSGLLPIGAWALFLTGTLTPGATLVVVSTLGAARWFAWTTASLVSQMPSARLHREIFFRPH